MNKQSRFLSALGALFFGAIVFFVFTKSSETSETNKERFAEIEKEYRIYAIPLPDKIEFAGEQAPLHWNDVREKLDREFLVNTYWQSNALLFIKRSHKYFPIIEPILKEKGIPDDFKYLALIESGFTGIVSPAGAEGYWQFMKTTAREFGLEVNNEVDERYHLKKATEAACEYLLRAKEKFGTWTLAAAGYNMGMEGLQKQLDKQLAESYYDLKLNEETSRYIYRLLAAKTILENPKKFGFHYTKADLWIRLPSNEITVDSTISNLAEFAKEQGWNYKILKEYNPWLKKNSLTVSTGNSYEIEFPREKFRNNLIDR
ncbi:MAG TPA: murein transglycosylase [Flavobacteriales bacterium]|jgi:membrane-bound lytic murein transglycosylase D|nr:murein transglycosylase [Flavobacteriales bacterium]